MAAIHRRTSHIPFNLASHENRAQSKAFSLIRAYLKSETDAPIRSVAVASSPLVQEVQRQIVKLAESVTNQSARWINTAVRLPARLRWAYEGKVVYWTHWLFASIPMHRPNGNLGNLIGAEITQLTTQTLDSGTRIVSLATREFNRLCEFVRVNYLIGLNLITVDGHPILTVPLVIPSIAETNSANDRF